MADDHFDNFRQTAHGASSLHASLSLMGAPKALVDLSRKVMVSVERQRLLLEEPLPIDMVLPCPACGLQHVDAPSDGWENPPHRSHLCYACGCIWRPADVPTNGVSCIVTRGLSDTWESTPLPRHMGAEPAASAEAALGDIARAREILSQAQVVHGVLVMPGSLMSRLHAMLDYAARNLGRIRRLG